MRTKTIVPFDTDFVLVNDAGRYLHKCNRGTTDKIANAKTYKTFLAAGRRCKGTDYKYVRVDEIGEE